MKLGVATGRWYALVVAALQEAAVAVDTVVVGVVVPRVSSTIAGWLGCRPWRDVEGSGFSKVETSLLLVPILRCHILDKVREY